MISLGLTPFLPFWAQFDYVLVLNYLNLFDFPIFTPRKAVNDARAPL
jgi:hypothetical protein